MARFMTSQFLAEIEAFLVAFRFPPTRFGVEAVGDTKFVFALRAGRNPRLDTAHRVYAFMAEQRKIAAAAKEAKKAEAAARRRQVRHV